MALTFAYTLDGDSTSEIKDFNAQLAGDTAPTGGTTGAYTPKLGDLVVLNSNGNVTSVSANTVTSVLGVTVGGNFLGLVPNTVVASTNAPGTRVKTYINHDVVFRIPLKSGASAPVAGQSCAVYVSGTGANVDYQLDTSTTGIFEVVDYDATKQNAFVIIPVAKRQIV